MKRKRKCNATYAGDGVVIPHWCGLPSGHKGPHRCDLKRIDGYLEHKCGVTWRQNISPIHKQSRSYFWAVECGKRDVLPEGRSRTWQKVTCKECIKYRTRKK